MEPRKADDQNIARQADSVFHEQRPAIIKRTENLLDCLIVLEWFGAIVCFVLYSPVVWGATSFPYPHVFYAFALVLVVALPPVILTIYFRQMKTMAQRQAALESAGKGTGKGVKEELARAQKELSAQAQEIGYVVDSLYDASTRMMVSISELASNAQETLAAVTETTTTVEQVRQTAEVSSQKPERYARMLKVFWKSRIAVKARRMKQSRA